jgi:hypothetical protein
LRARLRHFTGDGAYDRDDVYREVCQRHPDAAVIVPPRSSAVPSATAETAPTKRDRPRTAFSRSGRPIEEDDDLLDIWLRLLVNGGDANSGIELRRAFLSVLAEMSALDVSNLAMIESASKLKGDSASKGVWTHRLPEGGFRFPFPYPDTTDMRGIFRLRRKYR